MESQLKQLNKDKERLRHKAEYWRTKSYQLKSSSEDQEIQDVWLLSAHGLQNTHVSFVQLKPLPAQTTAWCWESPVPIKCTQIIILKWLAIVQCQVGVPDLAW